MFLVLRRVLFFALLTFWAGTQGSAAPSSKPFTFVAYGDTRTNPDAHRAIVALIVSQHPEFVLQSGDLVSDGGNPRQWAEFERITQPLRDAHIAYYPARGNHDQGLLYRRQVREPFDSGNKDYYAFTRHGCRFIVVDSEERYDPASAQYRWLEGELQKAHKTAVNTFVMFHESPFSVGPHGPNPTARRYLHPLFVRYHPRAVFCGHDHLYYRTVRNGVPYIVTGGGGAPLYDPVRPGLAIRGDFYRKAYHVLLCHVDGPRVTFTVLTPPGVSVDGKVPPPVIDKFALGPAR